MCFMYKIIELIILCTFTVEIKTFINYVRIFGHTLN